MLLELSKYFHGFIKDVWEFDGMKNIPNTLKEKLKNNFYIGIPEIEEKYESQIDGTKKLLISL